MSSGDPTDVRDLFQRITELIPRAGHFNDTIVRSSGTRYANESDLLSGEGAANFGGRWNRPGLRAIYASLDIITATFEAYQNFLGYGFSLAAIRPRVMAGARVALTRVCDLNDRIVRRKIGFTMTEMLDEDWRAIQSVGEESWTQASGRGCREAGFEALLVPSARHRRGKNIVIFPDRLLPTSTITPIAPEDLPPHPSDWAP